MEAAMKGPIMHQGNLFIIKGYEVLVFEQNGNVLDYVDTFQFPDPVVSLSLSFDNLKVKTTTAVYIIQGGPLPVTRFVQLVSEFPRLGGIIDFDDRSKPWV